MKQTCKPEGSLIFTNSAFSHLPQLTIQIYFVGLPAASQFLPRDVLRPWITLLCEEQTTAPMFVGHFLALVFFQRWAVEKYAHYIACQSSFSHYILAHMLYSRLQDLITCALQSVLHTVVLFRTSSPQTINNRPTSLLPLQKQTLSTCGSTSTHKHSETLNGLMASMLERS